MGAAAEHVDVGARAEDAVLAAREDDGLDAGVLEPDALQRVRQLDVDAEVVRVELQAVAGRVRALFLDREDEPRDGPVDVELPVDVAVRVRLEVRHGRCMLVGGGSTVKH